ncbi:MAG: gamma-glutamyl-gamma-aminobutyrate hydrolase family protein [Candidatus Adiutrix sp.]|nr:gamma-glutamyl-gamma-aminobutyrate hydrolase family protein [Candidatus Adiutrix sp.]
MDRSRDLWESALLAAALEQGKPVLGVCRGMQLMNRALGGSLWADLPSERPGQVEHQQTLPRARGSHRVCIEAGTRLAEILRFSEITVNSGHHQAVKDLAPPLAVSASADDGLTEAVEHRTANFALGVQWHPEGQFVADHSRALFAAFVKAAAEL